MLLMNVIANIQHICKFYFILSLGLLFFNSHDGGPYHIDWTGFYMIEISVMKELKKNLGIYSWNVIMQSQYKSFDGIYVSIKWM